MNWAAWTVGCWSAFGGILFGYFHGWHDATRAGRRFHGVTDTDREK